MASEIGLLVFIYPASTEKNSRILSLLEKNNNACRSPKAKCTTRTFFTPSTRPNAASTLVKKDDKPLIVGMEIYTSKDAFQIQLKDEVHQSYHAAIKNESLYAKDQQLVAYYPSGGFVARGDLAQPFGKGIIVMIAKFVLKGEESVKEKALDVLRPFADWVKDNEPDVLTYSIMTRPKAGNEVLMFERYKNLNALKGHGGSSAFKAMFKDLKPFVAETVMSEFEEINTSFVGNVVGGGGAGLGSKL